MTAVVCIDDKGGMTFNRRRQSRDRLLIDDLMSLTGDETICMNEYSQSLFVDYPERIRISDDFLNTAGEKDICFVETDDLSDFVDKINRLIIYRWNRHYPSTTKLKLDLSIFKLISTSEFSGSSHDNITREEYTR